MCPQSRRKPESDEVLGHAMTNLRGLLSGYELARYKVNYNPVIEFQICASNSRKIQKLIKDLNHGNGSDVITRGNL